MSKILLVADVHIGSYATKNPTPDYRLYQGSRTVSENIIKVGKQQGCDYIAFAGDVIEKSILRPYVLNEVKYFLDRVMSEFKGGWIIYGNHCLDCKSSDSKFEDSLLGVVLPPNLKYAHQVIENIDGTTIGFSNFQPQFDLSWIPGKVDVLVTHATICYAQSDFIKSQELDETKFDIAFCGDIHKKASLGKYVSIGIPQKCKQGDSDEATGVVLDCATKSWDWVDLNPDNNLLKMGWTENESEGGWHPETLTWLEHRRTMTKIVDGQVVRVDNPADKVEELFKQYISANALENVHAAVLKEVKNIDAGCIDFDFTLTRFYCKNWRSIEECTAYFDRGDKVLIIGANGAGKSSLTSAIKYAFADTKDINGLTSLKPFVQFGAKNCMAEVEFMYQGNLCVLRRGTKDFGMWINGVPQKYSNKAAFEKDAREKFPFIQYIDVFFLDADHNQLIGGMSVEKKSLIVSKFFKLDKIDTLHDTASCMFEYRKASGKSWKERINTIEEVIKFINSKLSEIQLPTISKADLEKSRLEGLEIQRKSTEWSTFMNRSASLQASYNSALERINELQVKISSSRDENLINNDIQFLQNELSNQQHKLSELGSIDVKLEYKKKERADLANEGNKAWTEAQAIVEGAVCSHCGQVIKTTQAALDHKKALEQIVTEVGIKIATVDQELQQLVSEWNNVETARNEIKQTVSNLNGQILNLMTEKNVRAQLFSDLTNAQDKAKAIEIELNSLLKPEEVYLPENFMTIMSQIDSQINAWNSYETNMADLAKHQVELEDCQKQIDGLQGEMNELQRYISMTGPTGEIYNEILTKLAEQFSDSKVNYTVKKYSNRGEHLNLESQFNNNGNLVDYAACSSGQKTVLDVHFLQKIVTKLGILVMDEFLKHLDPENHDVCIEMISDMSIGCIMLSSHMESVASFNNKTCRLTLNHNSMSEIEFT